jgi:hypothetical protein
MGILIRKFVRKIPRAETIMMFDFAASVDKCLGPPWRFPIMGSNNLVLELSTSTCGTLYGELTAVYHGMEILTSHCRILLRRAACSLKDDLQMRIMVIL